MAAPRKPTEDAPCVFEAQPGDDVSGMRDCSDELLPEGEEISDEERAEIEEDREMVIDWSRAREGAP